jgi:hypothetical protein
MIGMACALGAAMVCGLLFWLVDRRRPLFLCSLFSLAVAGYFLLVDWRWVSGLFFKPETYDQLFPQLVALEVLVALSGWLLALMFVEQFAIPGKKWWLAAQSVMLVPIFWMTWGRFFGGISGFYVNILWQVRVELAVCAAAAGWAVWRRRTGARLALTAALIGLVILRLDSSTNQILGPSFLVTFSLLVMSLLAAIGLQVQSARQAARAAELTAARMEIELLKKNLQPHFLLNTLTALTEVVEQSPLEAVRLIDDLAEELRSLSRMSAEKLIPLGQELDLCRAHLRVMSLRTGKAWQLRVENLDLASLVPPALFLTLIENGFTHQRIASTGGAFVLRRESVAGDSTTYIFVSPGETGGDPSRVAGGTGLRYVKARLDESFPERWSFRQGPTSAGWESVIEIRSTT